MCIVLQLLMVNKDGEYALSYQLDCRLVTSLPFKGIVRRPTLIA